MEHTELESLARELMNADESGQMMPSAPSARSGFDLNAAYEVEATLKRFREEGGARPAGRKVGYANKAMWRVFKLETLVWGHMYHDTIHYSDDNKSSLSLPRARSLKIEPEIVFALKETITTPGLDAAAALEAADWYAIGFEIIDCPFPDWKFKPADFVASFGLHAALIVGERHQIKPDEIAGLNEKLQQFKLRMLRNGEFVEEGSGKNSLGNPAACLAELSSAILKRTPSEPLAAGELISTGTLTSGHPLQPGDTWTVEVDGLPLPSLTLRLS